LQSIPTQTGRRGLDPDAGQLIQQRGQIPRLNRQILFDFLGWNGFDPQRLITDELGNARRGEHDSVNARFRLPGVLRLHSFARTDCGREHQQGLRDSREPPPCAKKGIPYRSDRKPPAQYCIGPSRRCGMRSGLAGLQALDLGFCRIELGVGSLAAIPLCVAR